MGKKSFRRAIERISVYAVPCRYIRNNDGVSVKILYDIYGQEWMRR